MFSGCLSLSDINTLRNMYISKDKSKLMFDE